MLAHITALPQAHAPTTVDEAPTLLALGSGDPAGAAAGQISWVVPGTRVGNYRVGALIAAGGMGEVFAGEHVHLRRPVAIKFLHRRLLGDPEALARFTAEGLATARIRHPGVVGLLDFGPHEGGAYLVTELLSGETLTARLAREPRLSVRAAADLGAQMADALHAAHLAGVVHRDLKPDNIFLVPDRVRPSGARAVVLDFGVAKLEHGPASPRETRRGSLLGTPLYMAPEQSLHPGEVDHRTDIYALGCVLYRLLCGEVPFRGSLMQILSAHQSRRPDSPRARRPGVSAALDALVCQMLAKAPHDRPPTMSHVARALHATVLGR